MIPAANKGETQGPETTPWSASQALPTTVEIASVASVVNCIKPIALADLTAVALIVAVAHVVMPTFSGQKHY